MTTFRHPFGHVQVPARMVSLGSRATISEWRLVKQQMSNLSLKVLNQKAGKAVACNYCFMSDRMREWGIVPQRPMDRPDDLPMLPWVGERYFAARPRVVIMMLNPGHAAAAHKLTRKELGQQFRSGKIDYVQYNKRLTPLVPEWGFGKVVRWLRAVRLDPDTIAFLNVALCAVAKDKYFLGLFKACFERHTRNIVASLKPDIVLLCGKKDLKPFVGQIESISPKVILTWHYRPMDTDRGKAELERVRIELERLTARC